MKKNVNNSTLPKGNLFGKVSLGFFNEETRKSLFSKSNNLEYSFAALDKSNLSNTFLKGSFLKKTMLNLCTLFDTNYLSRGLCMIDSLIEVCPDFKLFVFAFDNTTYSILSKINLPQIEVISLSEFEDKELLSIKSTRNRTEYFWTCTSSTILYCLSNFKIDHCIYIDADIYFYSNPQVLVEELDEHDVMITEHRYTQENVISNLYGKYCVQFMYFRNSPNGTHILNWWRNACLDWCYANTELGKFGDQKYLDNWTEMFKGVHVLKNLGGGVAPWNVQQYEIVQQDSKLKGILKKVNKDFEIIFYHFHHLRNREINFFTEFNLGPYRLNRGVIIQVYRPYIKKLKIKESTLKSLNIEGDDLRSNFTNMSFLRLFYYIIRTLFKNNRIICLK